MLDRHVKLSWNHEVLKLLAEEGYDPLYGARPLKRLIQHKVTNRLATALLNGEIEADSHMELILKEGVIDFIKRGS
ncbi:hypothetical protein N9Y92_04310 [Chlamydiales bacterium]|nr:hypothetical protein [Chlamydiales bacterium]